MTRDGILRTVEGSLLVIGVVLGVWCAAVLIEARFHQTLPLTVTQTLPGDESPGRAAAPTAGALLGRLEAPTVQMSTAVLEGSDDATLSRGAGHIEDTPLPGQAGNVGIAGHRDTVFRQLRHIKVGDPLELATSDRLYRYRIAKTAIVGPDDVDVLDPTGQPTLTLVTCYPFEFVGHAPRRFVVQAVLVDESARAATPAR